MITYVKINGFKSFHNFEMEFTPFTVIAGTNGSGKSNLFDALVLLANLADASNIKKAFINQRGAFLELFTQYPDNEYAEEIEFVVEMLVNKKVTDAWGNTATLTYTRLRYELKINRFINDLGMDDLSVSHERLVNLKHNEDIWIKRVIPTDLAYTWRPKVKTGKRKTPYIFTEIESGMATINVPQDGKQGKKRKFPLKNASRTVLSSFDTVDFPHVFAAKQEMKSWIFLQLNPEDLRQPTDKATGEDVILKSGKNLAGALHRISLEKHYSLNEISRKLQSFIPNFVEVKIVDDTKNRQFLIKLVDKDKKEYSSRVLSDGTLRILALCILEEDEKHSSLLCFEEPENGIHPFRIGTMANLLKNLTNDFTDDEVPLRQVIVNTHSPILVKYIHNWQKDNTVMIWYAKLGNRITDIDGKRMKIAITDILPVSKDANYQLKLDFSKKQQAITLADVEQYLISTDNILQ